jgi:hypothetical protein
MGIISGLYQIDQKVFFAALAADISKKREREKEKGMKEVRLDDEREGKKKFSFVLLLINLR